jgi:5'(3')-deoxyribonucleotidase
MEDAIKIIFNLNLKHKIFIASDAITTNNNACMTGKKMWMKRFLPFIELSQLIFIQNKSMLKGDLLIEDVAEQVKDFMGRAMLFDYPYNKDYEPTYRVNNWKEVEAIINRIGVQYG